jgi:very-short-patch-repair endonuclease
VGFEGDKLTVISEFVVKTVLEKFKMVIEKGGHTHDEAVSYRSRVRYFNHSKHNDYTFYVAENSQTKKNSTT